MGCGKSSVARELARLLSCSYQNLSGYTCYDLDDMISSNTGKTIPDIFKEEGEKGFRQIEFQVLKEWLTNKKGDRIIALGGGTVTTPECRQILKRNTRCIYLKAQTETLTRRLEKANDRPMLNTDIYGDSSTLHERIAKLMAAREAFYESAADITIEVDNLHPTEIAEEIIRSVLL